MNSEPIKRYYMTVEQPDHGMAHAAFSVASEDGGWVLYADHAARIAALESACKVLAKAHARGTKVRCELEKRLGDDSLTVACGGYEQMCDFCDVLNDVTANALAAAYVKESNKKEHHDM